MSTAAIPSTPAISASAGAKVVKPGQERAQNVAARSRFDALHGLLGDNLDVQSTSTFPSGVAVQNKTADKDIDSENNSVKDATRWKYERAYFCLSSSFKIALMLGLFIVWWLPSPIHTVCTDACFKVIYNGSIS